MAWSKRTTLLAGAGLLSLLAHVALVVALQRALPSAPPHAVLPLAEVVQVQLWSASPAAPAASPSAAGAAGHRGPALPAPAVAVAVAEPDPYIPSERLDQPLVPRSAPDTSLLEGLGFSGLPIRLRLYVDALGQVVDVVVLQASAGDEDAVAQMKAMFLATAYIPGQLHGDRVPARQDIELRLGDVS